MTAATLPSERVLTIPNVLSALRLAGVPVFLWLALGSQTDGAAFAVLAFAGVSDYLDGKLARALGQTSRLGIMLDPLADRLYILATVAALTIRGIIPWWLAALLVGRDVALAAFVPVLRRLGVGTALPVHYLGKAATFNLLYAFPLLLLSAGDGWLATVSRPLGWAFTLWGTALYWWSGLLYAEQVRRLLGSQRRSDHYRSPKVARSSSRAPVVPAGSAPGSLRDPRPGPCGISEVQEAHVPVSPRARRQPGADGEENTGGTP